jgi:hypothetical protein
MGCGPTLFLGAGGHVTCRYLECPEPTAVGDILADRETEHVVEFGEAAFTVRHPLRERLRDELLQCQLHTFIADLAGPPVRPGRYRATVRSGGGWTFSPVPEFPIGGTHDVRR